MEGLTKRENEILQLLKSDPTISREIIAEKLGISDSAVGTHIHNLNQKGYLLGRGYIIAPREEVVIIGGSNIDLKGYTDSYINNTSNPGQIMESLGGVGRNIAENLAILGREVVFLTAVGNDHYGEKIIEDTAEAGVNMEFAKKVDNKKTGIYLAHLDQNGELVGAISDMHILDEITPEYIKKHIQIIKQSSTLVLDMNLKPEVIKGIFDYIKGDSLKVIVEPVSLEKAKKAKLFLRKIDYITPNIDEAEILLGLKVCSEKSLDWRKERLVKAYNQLENPPAMIITCGEKGVLVITESVSQLLPGTHIPVSEIKETTGAGDAFTAGLIEGLLNGKGLIKSVRLGMKAAEITICTNSTVNSNLAHELKSND